MLKKVLFSVVVVLFVSGGAFAQIIIPSSALTGSIYQNQEFIVGDAFSTNSGLSSIALLYHGDSSSSVYQTVTIGNTHTAQTGTTGCWPFGCDTTGTQTQTGCITQSVLACGSCSVMTVSAFLDSGGEQQQFIGSSTDPKGQYQYLYVSGQEALLQSDGGGGGTAVNSATLYQDQFGANAAGSVSEASNVTLSQTSATMGAATSNPSTVSSATVATQQAQYVF